MELENYEVFCRQELPRSVRRVLEELIQNQSSPIEEVLRNQLVPIIRDCQDKIFSRYKESVGSVGGSPIRTRTGSVSSATRSTIPASIKLPSRDAMAADTTAPKDSVLTFLRPPPPQNDLGSQKITAFKPPTDNPTSDSGYSSDLLLPLSPGTDSSSSQFPMHPPPIVRLPLNQPQPVASLPNMPVPNEQDAAIDYSPPLLEGLDSSKYFSPGDGNLYLYDPLNDTSVVEYLTTPIEGLDDTEDVPPCDQRFYAMFPPSNYEWPQ
jgi:hypothetical protein